MEYKVYDEKSYKIHTIKTDRFKTSKIEVFFRMPVEKEKLPAFSLLSNIMHDCSLKYNTRRKLAIKCEELYNAYYSCFLNKIGNSLNMIFSIEFINPELIDEKNYLDSIIDFLFEVILKPDVKNNEFNLKNFNIAKNDITLDIISVDDNPSKKAINNALEAMDKESISSFNMLGTKEDIEKITTESLYKNYLEMINKSKVDVFAIGKTNLESIVSLIKKKYINHHINSLDFYYFIDNKIKNKPLIKEEESIFNKTYLVALYNLKDLNTLEKEVVFNTFNYLLGSGGLTSKLHKYIREEKGYTYSIGSMYFKYDNLLCISTCLDYKNVSDTLKLIDKSIKELKDGIFLESELEDAKQNILRTLKVNKYNKSTILNNYIFKTFVSTYSIDEKIDAITKITKKDITNVAKKIKKNTIYILKEAQNERD